MPLSTTQQAALRTNSVLRPDLTEQIIAGWDSFPPAKQAALTELLDLAQDAHGFLLQRAAERYPTFSADLNTFVAHRVRAATEAEEAEERGDGEAKEMEKLLQEIGRD